MPLPPQQFTKKITWLSPTEDIEMTCETMPNHSYQVRFTLGPEFAPEPSRTFGTWKEALGFANSKAVLYGLVRSDLV